MRRTFSTYGFFAAVYFECFYVTNFLGLNGSLLALILTLKVFQCFCQVFHSVLLLLYCKCYGYERLFFTLRHFWPFTPSPHLMQGLPQSAFIKVSLGDGSSSLKISGPTTVVQSTQPAHLFAWIAQCSANCIIWWVLFMY